MSSILQSPDILAALRQKKKNTARRLKESRLRVQEAAGDFTSSRKSASGTHGVTRLISNGIAAYEGIRLFMSVYSAVRVFFGFRRRR
ncbi:MAG: hypothetical protein J1F27_01890 [Prevotellaceae bacterium]|nr:hypothetical protein [Prevotellaceae bacterium]